MVANVSRILYFVTSIPHLRFLITMEMGKLILKLIVFKAPLTRSVPPLDLIGFLGCDNQSKFTITTHLEYISTHIVPSFSLAVELKL